MADVIAATLPFFAVIGLGLIAGWRSMIPVSAVRPINTFCFYYAMPALIGRALWRMEIGDVLDMRVLSGWLAAGLAVFALGSLGVSVLARGDAGRAAIRGQACAVGNIGFLGVPVVLGVFGETGAGPVAMALMVDLVVVIPMTIAWLEMRRSDGTATQAAIRALGRSISNPFFLSIMLGAGLSAFAVPVPGVLDRTLEFLGAAASPTALFSLGLYLAGSVTIQRPVEASTLSLIKLLVHPALVWLILGQWLGVDGPLLAATVTMAAMPVASNVFVIAETYETAPKLAADAVTLSTLASVVTLSVILAALT